MQDNVHELITIKSMESKNRKKLALRQVEKARENLNLAYKLLDYPEEIDDRLGAVEQSLDDLEYDIEYLKVHEPEAEDPTDRQVDEMILERLEKENHEDNN